MLQVSQANALVFTTLVGFGGVGVYAGYRVKNKADFLSGIRTQSGEFQSPLRLKFRGKSTDAPSNVVHSYTSRTQLVCIKSVDAASYMNSRRQASQDSLL